LQVQDKENAVNFNLIERTRVKSSLYYKHGGLEAFTPVNQK